MAARCARAAGVCDGRALCSAPTVMPLALSPLPPTCQAARGSDRGHRIEDQGSDRLGLLVRAFAGALCPDCARASRLHVPRSTVATTTKRGWVACPLLTTPAGRLRPGARPTPGEAPQRKCRPSRRRFLMRDGNSISLSDSRGRGPDGTTDAPKVALSGPSRAQFRGTVLLYATPKLRSIADHINTSGPTLMANLTSPSWDTISPATPSSLEQKRKAER